MNTAPFVNRLGFVHYVNYPPTGKWGGLLLLWRPGLDVDLVHISNNIIVVLVYSDSSHHPWLLNLIYCPAQYVNKNHFWNTLNILTEMYNGSLLTMRDFNTVLKQTKKVGGRPVSNSSTPKGLHLYME